MPQDGMRRPLPPTFLVPPAGAPWRTENRGAPPSSLWHTPKRSGGTQPPIGAAFAYRFYITQRRRPGASHQAPAFSEGSFTLSCGLEGLGPARGGRWTAEATLLTLLPLSIYLVQRARLPGVPHAQGGLRETGGLARHRGAPQLQRSPLAIRMLITRRVGSGCHNPCADLGLPVMVGGTCEPTA